MLVARDLAVTPPGAREPAVEGVSLSVGPGEWVVLTGPNGGGKTSVLLALAGLWPTSAGTLELDGAAFGPGSRDRAAAGIAVVLQDPSSQLLQPTVGEELAFAARNLGRPETEIAAAVARWSAAMGLEPDLDRDPATLSAGRQQLVLLAAALICSPRLLLADEPTAHLDAGARARVREAVASRVAEGLAVIWATQDRDEAAAAKRLIPVGSPDAGGPGENPIRTPAPHPAVTKSVLKIRVSPDPGGEGPRIKVGSPIDIRIGDRGVTALLGPNGAGKSVLLAAVAGLAKSPQVVVEWTAPPSVAPIVALQYPELQIFEETVEEEVVFAAMARGLERSAALGAASDCLASLGFDPPTFLDRRTWALSTGEKRVLEVVGALIAPASLVLLDEPTAGLDLRRRSALGELVIRCAAAGPCIVASQDVGWVEGLDAQTVTLGE